MTKEKAQALIGGIFGTISAPEGDRVVFTAEAMREGSVSYELHEAVSKAMFESELSFGFSYKIASRAVYIMANMKDMMDDNEEITEAIDGAVPVYTSEIMEIYASDHWAVDEAVKEFGAGEDSEQNAKSAWYEQISQMIYAIRAEIKKRGIIDEE